MCGIAGILDLQGYRPVDKALLIRCRDTMINRGPDEAGVFLDGHVGLAHRRLSIIDLASGQQPLSNADQSVTVTYNGEIYNFRELSAELEKLGCRFRTRCDTEVIVHAWQQWGAACVDRFRGMFAFALWDRRTRTLFLARDRLGIKPLVYTITTDGYFVFGSELKSIVAHPHVNRDICKRALSSFITLGYVPEPDSIYTNIKKLEAGHTLSIIEGRMQVPSCYWDIPVEQNNDYANASLADTSAEFLERLNDAVRVRLVADVPLGAFLSGGVDSSAIVALMASMSKTPVHTCSIGFENSAFDETAFASQVAERYGTDHHYHVVADQDSGNFDVLARTYDEPFADSSALPTLEVCRLARQNVKVALSGDGADELMIGYRRQRLHLKEEALRQSMPAPVRSLLFGLAGRLYPKADWAPRVFRAKTTFQALSTDSVTAYLNTVSMVPESMRQRVLNPRVVSDVGENPALSLFRRHASAIPGADPARLMQYIDMKTYLVNDILVKVDRASMAHSLEVRVPFLDHQFLEWMMGLPSHLKLKGNTGKAILKHAMEPSLPHDLLYRKKMGFSVPLTEWTRGVLTTRINSLVRSEPLHEFGVIESKNLKGIVEEHESGLADHSTILWQLLNIDEFARHNNS